MRFAKFLSLTALTLIFGTASAWAGAVITLPGDNVVLGVNDEGHLIYSDAETVTGLVYSGVGDALTPGCYCEGWGVSGTFGGDNYWGGANAAIDVSNLALVSFSSTPSSATSSVTVSGLPLTVTHAYAPASGAASSLFQADVTLTNTGSETIGNVLYRRAMDWDVPPTEFAEYVTIKRGTATALVYSSDDGFADSNPLFGAGYWDPETVNVDFEANGPGDHGAVFDFAFGDLAPGASKTFQIFYGAAGTKAAALSALGAVGAEVYSLGFSSTSDGPTLGTPATYIFGFKGVGGAPIEPSVPEPGSVLLLGSGVAALVVFRRRRTTNQG